MNLYKNIYFILGCFCILISIIIALSLLSYNCLDFSFNTASDINNNILGMLGSFLADIFYQLFGVCSFVFVCGISSFGVYVIFNKSITKIFYSFYMNLLTAVLAVSILVNINYFSVDTGLLGFVLSNFCQTKVMLCISTVLLCFCFCCVLNLNYSPKKALNNYLKKQINLILCFFGKHLYISGVKLIEKVGVSSLTFLNDKSVVQNNILQINDSGEIVKSDTYDFKIVYKEDTSVVFYGVPPIELLKISEVKQDIVCIKDDGLLRETAGKLEDVLADFGVSGKILNIRPGPIVTLYELEPAAGVKSAKIIGLSNDIARSLSAFSVRIALIPGKNVMGIEIPNIEHKTILLREILEGKEYGDENLKLPLVLGKAIDGSNFVADLSKMPHLLIAGTTGSGKSVAINAMIMSLLYRLNHEECKFVMIDPKMLELSVYNDIPHLISPVVTNPKQAIIALRWVVKEMEERYRLMSCLGVRNIDGYNCKIIEAKSKNVTLSYRIQADFDEETGRPIFKTKNIDNKKMPFIVVVVDEMADLMLVAGKEVEILIQRLSQMARAAGIHIIMATQRPSVDVITGVIKANFPTRISFSVSSKIDSRTILGEQGAESLLGRGDMLYLSSGSKVNRIHGPFVSDEEVRRVVGHIKKYNQVPEYVQEIVDYEQEEGDNEIKYADNDENCDEDKLYRDAVEIVIKKRKASISYIQRRLRIGYNKAAIFMEKMEEDGIVGPQSNTGRRQILDN